MSVQLVGMCAVCKWICSSGSMLWEHVYPTCCKVIAAVFQGLLVKRWNERAKAGRYCCDPFGDSLPR